MLDRALALLTESKPIKPDRTVERLQKGIRDELLARLVSQGLIREERRRALGILPRTVWPSADPSHESLLRAELSQVLVHGIEPTPRTAALVALLAAVDATPKVIPSNDRRGVKRRAKEIADGEWAGAAVRKAVQAVTAGVAAAATAAAVASSGG